MGASSTPAPSRRRSRRVRLRLASSAKVTLWHESGRPLGGAACRATACSKALPGAETVLCWRRDGFDAAVTVWRSDATSTKQPEEIVWRSKLDSVASGL